jgi:hypothetical protein
MFEVDRQCGATPNFIHKQILRLTARRPETSDA